MISVRLKVFQILNREWVPSDAPTGFKAQMLPQQIGQHSRLRSESLIEVVVSLGSAEIRLAYRSYRIFVIFDI